MWLALAAVSVMPGCAAKTIRVSDCDIAAPLNPPAIVYGWMTEKVSAETDARVQAELWEYLEKIDAHNDRWERHCLTPK